MTLEGTVAQAWAAEPAWARPWVRANSSCLGWDDDEYIGMLPGCAVHLRWKYQYKDTRSLAVDLDQRRIVGDLCAADVATSLQGASLDAIVCASVFEHLPCPEQAMRSLHQMLRPKGKLVFRSRSRRSPTNMSKIMSLARIL